jgi:hypothetical protein
MEILIRTTRLLWPIDSLVLALVLLRLGWLGFHRRYPALLLYLTVDLLAGVVGVLNGTASLTYYWAYFLAGILGESVLLIWMAREMFAELYRHHPGLAGVTQCTLKHSVWIGTVVTLGLAPVGIIHWGDAGYKCWEFVFFEIHRCLTFGVVVFVIAMWRKLRLIPLRIPRNTRVYAVSACVYLTFGGLVETVDLIVHTRIVTRASGVCLLAASLVFHVVLVALARRPSVTEPPTASLDTEDFGWLYSMASLFARADEAHRRGRVSSLRRLRFLRFPGSIYRVWKACSRAGSFILGLAQKE